MSVKVKVSFQEGHELAKILKLLDSVMKSYKIARNQQGIFTKAYIEIDNNELSKVSANCTKTCEKAKANKRLQEDKI